MKVHVDYPSRETERALLERQTLSLRFSLWLPLRSFQL